MSEDAVSLAAEVAQYASAAVGAYGHAVLGQTHRGAADAKAGLGRRLLRRIFGAQDEGDPLPGPLADLAGSPQDIDALAAVRLAIRKALAGDPTLAKEVQSMLASASGVSQQTRADRDAYSAGRDQTIINYLERPTSQQEEWRLKLMIDEGAKKTFRLSSGSITHEIVILLGWKREMIAIDGYPVVETGLIKNEEMPLNSLSSNIGSDVSIRVVRGNWATLRVKTLILRIGSELLTYDSGIR